MVDFKRGSTISTCSAMLFLRTLTCVLWMWQLRFRFATDIWAIEINKHIHFSSGQVKYDIILIRNYYFFWQKFARRQKTCKIYKNNIDHWTQKSALSWSQPYPAPEATYSPLCKNTKQTHTDLAVTASQLIRTSHYMVSSIDFLSVLLFAHEMSLSAVKCEKFLQTSWLGTCVIWMMLYMTFMPVSYNAEPIHTTSVSLWLDSSVFTWL